MGPVYRAYRFRMGFAFILRTEEESEREEKRGRKEEHYRVVMHDARTPCR